MKIIGSLDRGVSIKWNVETFGLVYEIINRWLSCSIDSVIDLNIDGQVETTLVEIKILLAINSHEEIAAIANRIGKLK